MRTDEKEMTAAEKREAAKQAELVRIYGELQTAGYCIEHNSPTTTTEDIPILDGSGVLHRPLCPDCGKPRL